MRRCRRCASAEVNLDSRRRENSLPWRRSSKSDKRTSNRHGGQRGPCETFGAISHDPEESHSCVSASAKLVTASLLGVVVARACDLCSRRKGPKGPPPHDTRELHRAHRYRQRFAGHRRRQVGESQIIAAVGTNAAYCQVNILYGENPDQNINIRVGLPLNSVDGGTGGVQGAWNGRTQGIGGGGCSGSLGVNGPVNTRLCGIGQRCRPLGRQLRARRQSGRDLQLPVHQRLHSQRDEAADPTFQGGREYVLRDEARLQLLERLLDGRPAGLRARAGAAEGARRDSRQRAGDLLDAIPDRADVGSDRDEATSSAARSPRPSSTRPPPRPLLPAMRPTVSPTASSTIRGHARSARWPTSAARRRRRRPTA